ncbi:MAG TPA: glycosyltransferase family 9 protein [Dongiaceae bacterium]|nr:glycosyltransferase family 9 protein [Dongiaceae bacterium]
MKPQLLVVELWGLGDLVIATPFLRAASEHYAVTLLAKPYAQDLQVRFWSEVRVVPFTAPWTAFTHKYLLWSWPWWEIYCLRRTLAAERFEFGLSARWDPRDHLLLGIVRARARLGFPRLGSLLLLNRPLARPEPGAHRYENWRVLARALGFELPPRDKLALSHHRPQGEILVHTGAGQPVRVWPLERYRRLVASLRQAGHRVRVACDPDQHDWWLNAGEKSVAMPRSVAELLALADQAGAFIGNDSGPGHLAAFCGVPTFTIFGPQLPEWFAPLHPASDWLEGKACPYKPCSDYCQFAAPCCMLNSGEAEVCRRVDAFLSRISGRKFYGAP